MPGTLNTAFLGNALLTPGWIHLCANSPAVLWRLSSDSGRSASRCCAGTGSRARQWRCVQCPVRQGHHLGRRSPVDVSMKQSVEARFLACQVCRKPIFQIAHHSDYRSAAVLVVTQAPDTVPDGSCAIPSTVPHSAAPCWRRWRPIARLGTDRCAGPGVW